MIHDDEQQSLKSMKHADSTLTRKLKMTPTKNAGTADDEDEARELDLDSKADDHARRTA